MVTLILFGASPACQRLNVAMAGRLPSTSHAHRQLQQEQVGVGFIPTQDENAADEPPRYKMGGQTKKVRLTLIGKLDKRNSKNHQENPTANYDISK